MVVLLRVLLHRRSTEGRVLIAEALVLWGKSLLLLTEALLLLSEALVLLSEALVLLTESLVLLAEALVLLAEARVLSTKSLVLLGVAAEARVLIILLRLGVLCGLRILGSLRTEAFRLLLAKTIALISGAAKAGVVSAKA